MKFLSLLLYFLSIYYTYYKSSKYRANPYLWTGLGFLLPFISSLVAFLHFRGRKLEVRNPPRLPLGYRSKTPWKMIFASIIYGFLILGISVSVLVESPDIGQNSSNTRNSNTGVSTIEATDSAETGQNDSNTTKQNDTQKEETQKDSSPEPSQGPGSSTAFGKLSVHFIDVGQADSILIQTPNNKVMLVDAGNNADGDTVVSYLKSQGINEIDVLIGTHPHEDHIGGMDRVIYSFNIGKVYLPKAVSSTKTYEDVLEAVKSRGLKVTTASGGVNIPLDSAIKSEVFAPNGGGYEDINNFSAVIKLTYNKTSFLLTGDAEDVSEQEMLARGYNLKADVLKVGHHGSSSSTTSNFLEKVAPKFAVIMVGMGNDYGHPHKQTMDRLANRGITVYRTDQSGTVVAESDGSRIIFDAKPGDYSYGGIGKDTSKESPSNTGDSGTSSGSSGTQGGITSSNEKLYVDANGNGLIKGNINSKNEKIYHMPDGAYYDKTIAEAWFKTESDAQEAGYRRSKR